MSIEAHPTTAHPSTASAPVCVRASRSVRPLVSWSRSLLVPPSQQPRHVHVTQPSRPNHGPARGIERPPPRKRGMAEGGTSAASSGCSARLEMMILRRVRSSSTGCAPAPRLTTATPRGPHLPRSHPHTPQRPRPGPRPPRGGSLVSRSLAAPARPAARERETGKQFETLSQFAAAARPAHETRRHPVRR